LASGKQPETETETETEKTPKPSLKMHWEKPVAPAG